jgi:hypothetical protein
MNSNFQVGQVWYDTKTNEIKIWDGDDWIIMSVPYTPDPYYVRAKFVKRFAFLPHKCELTGRIIWMEWAIRGEETIGGWSAFITEYRWFDAGEHLLWMLKISK